MDIRRIITSFSILAVCSIMTIGVPAPATAQSIDSKWQIEIHGAAMLPGNQTGGTAKLPSPGETIPTAGIYGPPAPPVLVLASSRRVSSWYFGDGAVLFDQASTAVAANPVAMTAPFPGRIVALDPVLGTSLGAVDRGAGIGVRLTRAMTPRFDVELSVDYNVTRIHVTDANRDAIEATRASFIPAFQGVIASNASRTVTSLTSVSAVDEGSAHQLFTSGTLIVNLKTTGSVTPYAAVGAGLVSLHGDRPVTTLRGNYQFSNTTTGASFNETDSITVRDTRSTQTAIAVLGGGVKFHVSPRWGVRIDARVFIGENSGSTELDATPTVALGQLPAGRVTLNADPTIQFGNSSNPVTGLGVTALAPSTLSGPALSGFRTWAADGISTHASIATGIYLRF
jgi:hypothetical protein